MTALTQPLPIVDENFSRKLFNKWKTIWRTVKLNRYVPKKDTVGENNQLRVWKKKILSTKQKTNRKMEK